MSNDPPPSPTAAFSDTTLGKIVIGLVIAAGSAGISLAVARYTIVTPPPVAVIDPDEATVRAGDVIEFSALGSSHPGGEALRHHWTLGGLPFAQSPVGTCDTRRDPAIAACRFALPGTFALGVTVSTAEGQRDSASASVRVTVENGYVGILLTGGDTYAAYRELLYGIDWVAMQALSPRPIVLYDPDSDAPVYAASFTGLDAERAKDRPTGALDGRKLVLSGFPRAAMERAREEFYRLGAAVIDMPAGEVALAMTRGVADGGAVVIDDPAQLSRMVADPG